MTETAPAADRTPTPAPDSVGGPARTSPGTGRFSPRGILAAFVVALAVALVAHAVNILALFAGQGVTVTVLVQLSNYFALSSLFLFVLVFLAALIGGLTSWYYSLISGVVSGVLAALIGSVLVVATSGTGFDGSLWGQIFGTLASLNLIFWIAATVATVTLGRAIYTRMLGSRTSIGAERRVALVRIPASNLAEGLLTHLERQPVDAAAADAQWDDYVAALAAEGWQTVEVPAADTLADSVFVEDAVVLFGDTAVVTSPGSPSRRDETAAVEESVRALRLGLEIERIQLPGTLDGGDVLKVDSTVYVGRSGRTNAEGIRQLRLILAPLGYRVVAVPISKALHLKSAATALPDGTVIGDPALIDEPGVFGRFLPVPEASGADVVVLSDDAVLMAASAPKTAELIADLGYRVVTVDISEFEKLEAGVTCLSVRIR
ncbi:MAG: dimethylargininase [Microbacteriaceae bacterium]